MFSTTFSKHCNTNNVYNLEPLADWLSSFNVLQSVQQTLLEIQWIEFSDPFPFYEMKICLRISQKPPAVVQNDGDFVQTRPSGRLQNFPFPFASFLTSQLQRFGYN